MLLMSNIENKYYFDSMNELVVFKAPADKVLDFVKENADVSFDLASRFATGLNKLLIKSESTLYKEAYHKVITILLFLSEKLAKIMAI